jgi:hypothetical protein
VDLGEWRPSDCEHSMMCALVSLYFLMNTLIYLLQCCTVVLFIVQTVSIVVCIWCSLRIHLFMTDHRVEVCSPMSIFS